MWTFLQGYILCKILWGGGTDGRWWKKCPKNESFLGYKFQKFSRGVFRPPLPPVIRRGKKIISKEGGGAARNDQNAQYISLRKYLS